MLFIGLVFMFILDSDSRTSCIASCVLHFSVQTQSAGEKWAFVPFVACDGKGGGMGFM